MSGETVITAPPVPRAQLRRRSLWRAMLRDVRAVLSFGYLALLVLVSIFAAKIAPYSPIDQNVAELLMPPSAAHWLGTDDLGRDVLSRLIWGRRTHFMRPHSPSAWRSPSACRSAC